MSVSALDASYRMSPCEIKTMTNDLLTNAVIESVYNDTLEIINQSDKLPVIHCNTTIKINVYNDSLGFKVLVGKVFLSTPDFMRIIEVQNLADYERRNFFRIIISVSCKAYVIEDEIPDDGALKLFPVHVGDISLSGCYIKTKKPLTIAQRLVINFPLSPEKSMALCAEVQRIHRNGNATTGYGCSFLDISTKQSDFLCGYIFEKQREQIKSMRELHEHYL